MTLRDKCEQAAREAIGPCDTFTGRDRPMEDLIRLRRYVAEDMQRVATEFAEKALRYAVDYTDVPGSKHTAWIAAAIDAAGKDDK